VCRSFHLRIWFDEQIYCYIHHTLIWQHESNEEGIAVETFYCVVSWDYNGCEKYYILWALLLEIWGFIWENSCMNKVYHQSHNGEERSESQRDGLAHSVF
jgi:hypothetical protein